MGSRATAKSGRGTGRNTNTNKYRNKNNGGTIANQLDVSALGFVSPLDGVMPGSGPLTPSMPRLDSGDCNNRINCRACSVGVPALIKLQNLVVSRLSWLVYACH